MIAGKTSSLRVIPMDKDSVERANGGKPQKNFGVLAVKLSYAEVRDITKYGSTILSFLFFSLRTVLYL